jgi:hypothetical protein
MRVRGVALGRFMLTDGRPADRPGDAADMVAHFEPDTVPILSRHGGILIGYLDSLAAQGADLHFTGDVTDFPDLIERLRNGGPVSIERSDGGYPRADGVLPPFAWTLPQHFRGRLRIGANLVGVALTTNPAARGSVMWIADD